MKVFAVFQNGVYRHECAGIFDTLDKAENCAEELVAAEKDTYHNYEVCSFELNEKSKYEINWHMLSIKEVSMSTHIKNGCIPK